MTPKTFPSHERKYQELIQGQRRYFQSGVTQPYEFRMQQIQKLREVLQKNETALFQALHQDLRKAEFESYVGEVGMVLEDIRHGIKHLKKWMRPRRASVPLSVWPGKARVHAEPFGVVLVISPWNYPVQLALTPVYGAMAAGNCVVLKPSELSPHTSGLIAKLMQENFPPEYVAVIEGGAEDTQALLQEHWDYIFFTGSTPVGRLVMQAATQYVTPLTLELGGKSPAIVDETADLKIAARRIAWGKFFNAGQTCVAPDHLWVHEDVKAPLVEEFAKTLERFYGKNPQQSPDYGRIINRRHFDRLLGYLREGQAVIGGQSDAQDLYLAPTLLEGFSKDAAVDQEEIFGPILPVKTFRQLEEVMLSVDEHPSPLALYFFTRSAEREAMLLQGLRYGCGCINDTMSQMAVSDLPFGGVGMSGFGSYHGRQTFETFTHRKSIFKKPTWVDPQLRYPPYAGRIKLAKRLMG